MQPNPVDVFRQLLERAIAEPDQQNFVTMLDEISTLLGVDRHETMNQAVASASNESFDIRPSMETDIFDIFSGQPDRDAVWVESCTGIDQARARAQEIAAVEANDYFVFHASSKAILYRLNRADLVRVTQAETHKSAKGAA